jgi:hypothetical protein
MPHDHFDMVYIDGSHIAPDVLTGIVVRSASDEARAKSSKEALVFVAFRFLGLFPFPCHCASACQSLLGTTHLAVTVSSKNSF